MRNIKLSTRSKNRRETKKVLAGRAEAAEEAAMARLPSRKKSLLEAVKRRKVMMKVMKMKKRRRNSRGR